VSGAFLLASAWQGLRDRWLASPAFRRRAAAFPLTRAIANRSARAMFDLCAGFVYSQVLAACVKLRLFDLLAEGPQPVRVLATRMSLPEDAARRLLGAAAALRLAEARGDGNFGLGTMGAVLVDNPALTAMIAHHALLYDDLRDPVALLRGERRDTRLSRYWAYARQEAGAGERVLGEDEVAGYSELMRVSQALVADQVLDAYPVARHRCLLDVGGGDGAFLAATAARAPALRLVLFDLPAVADRARTRFAAAGLGDRATAIGGDFRVDRLPEGADLVSLVRVVHDHDDEVALALLRATRRALPPGGTLLLAEPMSATPGAETVGDAYFAFYLLAMGQGRCRSTGELLAMLAQSGFPDARVHRTDQPLQTRLIVARAG